MPHPPITIAGLLESAERLASAQRQMHEKANEAIARNPANPRDMPTTAPEAEKGKPK